MRLKLNEKKYKNLSLVFLNEKSDVRDFKIMITARLQQSYNKNTMINHNRCTIVCERYID